ncbi:aromatic-ring-hydroxylating dioxygenase subunit beta [Paraburkholderia sp. HP33-1]|uniref:aromatic-ring-hydroxylating dioxygenase subunit beta n=1 Tax=Paraburkholderia sp. HP33-1 TaxID=2883243 RepID=UPI001F3BE78E|nr:aromatic-ring-hydroxylating dioxygenase subunit beta [Paraburkholderia sp. HP33-1]
MNPLQAGRDTVADLALYYEIVNWMNLEAELFDGLRERDWIDHMVSREIVYQVPIRNTVSRAHGSGFVKGSFHLDENYGSLLARVARNETGYAWAEDPPSRIRHFVSNVRVSAPREDGVVAVRTSLLIYRTRQEQTVAHLFSGERHDLLERQDGGWKLKQRIVYLDATAIPSHNLAMFF